MGDKIKRTTGVFAVWFSTVILVVLLSVIITVSIMWTTTPDEYAGMLLLSVIIGVIPVMYLIMYAYINQHVETLEYIIYEYDVWCNDTQEYMRHYIVSAKVLEARFIYHHYLGTHESSMNVQQIEAHINTTYLDHDTWDGHLTKECAMKEILEFVKYLITEEKETKNINVCNIKTCEVLNVSELKERIIAGKLK